MSKLIAVVLVALLPASFSQAQPVRSHSQAAENGRIELKDWRLQSGCKVNGTGADISKSAYPVQNWIPVRVPATVLAAQVAAGIYRDPYFGMNLRSIPGTTYPPEKVFSQLPMSDKSPYHCAWWYRTEFTVPTSASTALHFDGINYRANIWLNGKQIASSNDVAGAYRTYEFLITEHLVRGRKNVLALEVFAPTEKDLGINWVDWNPTPPDKDMGLWRGVWISQSGPLELRAPQIVTRVNNDAQPSADVTISTQVQNTTAKPIHGTISGRIGTISFSRDVDLPPNEATTVLFSPADFKQLHIGNPRLWWPWQMGAQEMYTLALTASASGRASDRQLVRFGIRQVTSEFTPQGGRLFKVNGKPLLIRGGGWSPDMLLREDSVLLEQHFRYVRDMGLNAIRLEGKMETQRFYDLADRYGILVMAGWCCCDIWEQWKDWPPENHKIAVESLKSQIVNLRNHPSVFVWLNGSDNPPVPEVEQEYLAALKEVNWQNPVVSSASQAPTSVTGPSGVKMTGPYDWVPPTYWYVDTKNGGAYGFNTETSSGPAPPPVASLMRFVPKEHAWPIDEFWNYHAGLEGFTNIHVFREAMNARYGQPSSIDDFMSKSQAMTYEGERAMFESYSRNKYRSTGVIQWMLNNAWPSIIWHLYDFYLTPAGGYFGTKKATEPLHAVYGYDDRSVSIVNSTYRPAEDLRISATVYNFDLQEKYRNQTSVKVDADGVVHAFDLPEIPDLTTTYFVKLQLTDATGKVLSDNFYWLSTRPEVFDWAKTDYTHTPTTQTGDLTALASLPKTEVAASATMIAAGKGPGVRVTLRNPTKNLAFMTCVRLLDHTGADVLPVHWDDNYVTLMPGEQRVITTSYEDAANRPTAPSVKVEGWNIKPRTVTVTRR